jgi:hypothetical protein
MMRKNSVLVAIVIILQIAFVMLYEQYVIRPNMEARVNRLSERLGVGGPPEQALALTNALSGIGNDASSHVSSVAIMMIVLNSLLFSAKQKEKE